MISFGTSGHRGIIAKTFTQSHVIAIAHAIADTCESIIIGYDPRKGNSPSLEDHSYTKALVDTLINRGITVYFCTTYTPTPTISWTITELHLDGGLILTASHNPPEYNGIKFNPKNGAPAPEEITRNIQEKANHYLNHPPKTPPKKGPLIPHTPKDAFCSALLQTINAIIPFTKMTSPIIADVKHGTGGPYWETFASLLNTHAFISHKDPLSNFGDIEPNPTKHESLTQLSQIVLKNQASMAIANDPDCDRHVILDEKGDLITPEELALIITQFCIDQHIPIQGIVSTVASSRLLKEMCQKHQLDYQETKVGFKHFAPFLLTCKKENKLGIAVESSGGLSISMHTFEKCGFLPPLLLQAIVQHSQKSVSELKKAVLSTLNKACFSESEYRYPSDQKQMIEHRIRSATKETLSLLFENEIDSLNTTDGLKIIFNNNDWVLIRLSGTEPVARFYSESDKAPQIYIVQAKKLFSSSIVFPRY